MMREGTGDGGRVGRVLEATHIIGRVRILAVLCIAENANIEIYIFFTHIALEQDFSTSILLTFWI